MPAPMDMESDRPLTNGHPIDPYSTDFFDGLCQIELFFFVSNYQFFFLIVSVADLADLLKSEPQDDFIVGLQNTLSDVFSSPTIFSLAYVHEFFIFYFK